MVHQQLSNLCLSLNAAIEMLSHVCSSDLRNGSWRCASFLGNLRQKYLLLEQRLQFSNTMPYEGIISLFPMPTNTVTRKLTAAKIFVSYSGSLMDQSLLGPFLQSLSQAGVQAICPGKSSSTSQLSVDMFDFNALHDTLATCSTIVILMSRDYQDSVLCRAEAELIQAAYAIRGTLLPVHWVCLDEAPFFISNLCEGEKNQSNECSWLKTTIGECVSLVL
jgi:hypothetical protein